MAYGCGYATGYADTCGYVPVICIPTGYGSGIYAGMAYGGDGFCSNEAGEQVIPAPKSNVLNICIVRC